MSKLLIPTVLATMVLVAGILATIPVEKAGTVHQAIIANVGQVFKDEATNLSATPGDASSVTFDRTVAGVDGKRFKAFIAGTITDDVDGDVRGPSMEIQINDGDNYTRAVATFFADEVTGTTIIITQFGGIDPVGPDPTYRIVLDESDATTSIADFDFVTVIEIVG